jgi:hypothetical protein
MADWWLDEETVGELISRARDRLGKSQYALAEALREVSGRSDGVPDRSMVARWETRSAHPYSLLARSPGRRPAAPGSGSRQSSRRDQGPPGQPPRISGRAAVCGAAAPRSRTPRQC